MVSTETETTRVLIVASDPLARASLARLLDEAGCTIAGQVSSDVELASEAEFYRPDVVLWDLGWDPTSEIETSLETLAELAETGLPAVVLLPDETYAQEVWNTGCRGILLREAAASPAGVESLLAALRTAVAGLLVLEPALADQLTPTRGAGQDALVEGLTSREGEVLQLLADGLTNRAIAQRLGISEHTIKFHVNAILGKLGAQSRTEAVVRASRLGLLLL